MFSSAHFTENVYVTGAEFTEEAYFHQTRFTGAYNQFGHTTLARADFRATEFGRNVDFTGTSPPRSTAGPGGSDVLDPGVAVSDEGTGRIRSRGRRDC